MLKKYDEVRLMLLELAEELNRAKTTSVTEVSTCISRNKGRQEGRESCHSEGEPFCLYRHLERKKPPPLTRDPKHSGH